MASDRQNLQDAFLNHVRKTKVPVTIFLINGVKLQGVITWFDNFCVLLRRDGQSQLVYKHAISTIMPSQPAEADKIAPLQLMPDQIKLLMSRRPSHWTAVNHLTQMVTPLLTLGPLIPNRLRALLLYLMPRSSTPH